MLEKIHRCLTDTVKKRLKNNPAVAILGPRQCGKTTLAVQIIKQLTPSVYLDLENPADLAKLEDPLAYFSLHENDLVCLDEIQRTPEIFTILRSIIDDRAR
ncbi:AAA family ATPase, partial [candidate division CSSED10-310 bacterium]